MARMDALGRELFLARVLGSFEVHLPDLNELTQHI